MKVASEPNECVGKTREELIEMYKHRGECISALGKVLEDFSALVILCCERMEKAQGVLGRVRNPYG